MPKNISDIDEIKKIFEEAVGEPADISCRITEVKFKGKPAKFIAIAIIVEVDDGGAKADNRTDTSDDKRE